MKTWSRIARWGLVSFMVINIAGAVYYFVLQGQLRNAKPQPTLAVGSKFPAFSAIDVQGAQWEPGVAPCRVIRVTADGCEYCKKDKQSYEKILEAARRASCEIIEVAPKAGGMAYDPRPGVVQLKYVDRDIGSALYPFVTPQTIILDADWTVKMTRRGMFNAQSLAASLALLGAQTAPVASR